MRIVSPRLSLPIHIALCSALLVSAACSNNTSAGGNSTTGGADTASDSGLSEDTGAGDTASGTDVAQNDTAGGTDTTTGTDATAGTDADSATDAAILDTADGETLLDSSDGFVAPDGDFDGGGIDIDFPDVPDVAPGSCTTDKDCLGLNFAPCQIGYCDATSKMCKVKPAADGGACAVGGPCGGPGTCKSGSCDAPSTCKPDVCSPQPLECGGKLTIELSQLGASAFSGYGSCSSNKWDGPEAAILLSSDVTMVATLSFETTGVTADVELFDIAPTVDGKCDTVACDDSSYYSLTLGLPAGVPRIAMLDTSALDTGSVTLTLDCTAATYCGDNTCSDTETCTNCPTDCGSCANTACGDKTCDATTENCLSCPGDCGACVPGCTKSKDPGCPTCEPVAEQCVCSQDKYCCTNSWDSLCVKEFTACPGVTCPVFNDVCGDGVCGSNEFSSSCPADCGGVFLYCGDGFCSASEKEDCTNCAQDCGFCLVISGKSSGCGDGVCKGDEDCTTCAADCGKCGDYSCACLEDPTCCTEEFGFFCQDTCNSCIAQNGGGSCPVSNCGDGVCAGETCQSCSADCGDCPAYCGDGNCDTGEDSKNCPADCAFGCQGKCGKSSKEADGTFCYCDSYCTTAGDCCSDKTTYCP